MFNAELFQFLPWQKHVMLITMTMLFCLVSSYDIEQEEQTQALYCDMTSEGSWPAYDKDVVCKD